MQRRLLGHGNCSVEGDEMRPEEEESLLKQGHMAKCDACVERYFPRWAKCKAMNPAADLDTAKFEGAADTCPLRNWDSVTAAGVAAENALNLEAKAVRWLKRYEPMLKRLPNKEADLTAALDEMVNLVSEPGERPISLHPLLRDAVIAALEKADA